MRALLALGAFLAGAFVACSGSDDSSPGTGGDTGGAASGGASTGGTSTGGTSTGGQNAGGGGQGTGGSGQSSGGSPGTGGAGGSDEGGAPGTSGTGGLDSAGATGEAGAGGVAGADPGCDPIVTFEDGLTPEREIFVDAAAAGPGDGSAEDPYPNLEAALGDATPGSAIRLRPGTYAGGAFVSELAGTAEAPIWIGGVPGGPRPVISGGDEALHLGSARYLVLHDLEVTGQAQNGINADDSGETADDTASHHLVFRDLFIHDIGSDGNQDCLKLSGIGDYWVFGSEFRACGAGSAIDHVGCHRGLIAENTFADLAGNGVQSKGGSEDIEITRNVFLDAGERAVNMGGSTGFEFFRPPLSMSQPNFEARDIRVLANVFRGGISPIAFVGCVECLAANNTIVDPQNWVFRILQETTSDGEYSFLPAASGRFVNNVVYFERGALSTFVNVGPDTDPESFELANNLWYAYDAPGDSEPSPLPAPEANAIYGEDPGFADLAADDYSIDATSPAAGTGLALDTAAADRDGLCYADPPSIGAYEPL